MLPADEVNRTFDVSPEPHNGKAACVILGEVAGGSASSLLYQEGEAGGRLHTTAPEINRPFM
jgi:hypothetical protein